MSKQVFYKNVIKSIMANDYSATIEEYVEATEADLAEAGYVKREKVKLLFCKRELPLWGEKIDAYKCSGCGNWVIGVVLYCPGCGSELVWEGV
jgi:predicted RNA-binding Zn-ribbon protein involved in translation (DUF1610 family)